jgi:hypothetical protein
VLPPLLKKTHGIFLITNIKLITTNLITNKHSHLMDYSVKEKNAYEIDKKIVCDHKNAYEIEEYEKMILKISFYIAHCDADGYKK